MVYQYNKKLAMTLGSITSNEVSQAIYSSEEKVIGQWIDGRPLYRIAIEATTGSNTSTGGAVATIPGDAITPIRLYGMVYAPNNFYFPINCEWIAGGNSVSSIMQGNTINCHPGYSIYTNCPAVFIVEYVKPADTALIQESADFFKTLSSMPVTVGISGV